MGVGRGQQEKPNLLRGVRARPNSTIPLAGSRVESTPRKQGPRERRGDPRGGGTQQGLAKSCPKFFPLEVPSTLLAPSSRHPLKQSSAFPSLLFPPYLGPPLFFSPRLYSAPLQSPSPPLLFGRPPRQSPPLRAPARPSAPPRLSERLRLLSQAALRFAQSGAICQRSRRGGAARPAGARVTND